MAREERNERENKIKRERLCVCVRDKLPHHDGFVRHNVFPEVGHDSCICPETSTTSFHAYKGGDRSGGVRNNCLRKNTYGWPININNSHSLLSSPFLKNYKTILIQTLYQGLYINYVTHFKGTGGFSKTLQGARSQSLWHIIIISKKVLQ